MSLSSKNVLLMPEPSVVQTTCATCAIVLNVAWRHVDGSAALTIVLIHVGALVLGGWAEAVPDSCISF